MAGSMSKAQGKNQSARTQAKPASHLASQPASISFHFFIKKGKHLISVQQKKSIKSLKTFSSTENSHQDLP